MPNENSYICSPSLALQLQPVTLREIGEFYYSQRESDGYDRAILSLNYGKQIQKMFYTFKDEERISMQQLDQKVGNE